MVSFEQLKAFNNEAVDFLVKRLSGADYRGRHTVQHYRYDFDIIYKVLDLLNQYAPSQGLLAIRTRDLSKQSFDDPIWADYAKLCGELKMFFGKNTQDVLRKIIFVDLERLGFLHRYNKKKQLNKLFTRNANAYVSISDVGLELLAQKDVLKRSFLIGKRIELYLHDCIENLLYMLRETDLRYIDVYEYMFFMTAIDFDSSFKISLQKAESLIREYRKLSPVQRKQLVKYLQSLMVPAKKDKKGRTKKDFHNWKNETQSLFANFLQYLVFFSLEPISRDNVRIVLSNQTGLFADSGTRLDRSVLEKQLYMEKHKVQKKAGFELHHIIPLAYSTSLEHFKLLDNWLNMIYIDGYSHGQMQNHITLAEGENNDLKLVDDIKNTDVYLKYKENVLYSPDNKQKMLDKNQELRNIQI